MEIVLKIFNWIFSIFCFSSLIVYGLTIPTILLAILGIASLPLEFITEKWEELPFYIVLRPLIIGVIFFLFLLMLPTDTSNDDVALQDNNSPNHISQEESAKKPLSEEDASIVEEQETEVNVTNKSEEVTTESVDNSKSDSPVTVITSNADTKEQETASKEPEIQSTFSLSEVQAYTGKPYTPINNNVPYFTDSELTTSSYESYSELDNKGRCGVVIACIGKDIMPTEERGNIGSVKPTGWHTVKYNIVDGNYLYNRCHLIGFQLTGENANTKNLITGTRYMNVDGMLPFENMVADYVQETGNHVMYRVTPVFDGNNLLASGVLMEAMSVEDNGDGILFNVFCYNVQPGIKIDYATGASSAENIQASVESKPTTQINQEPVPIPEPAPEPTPQSAPASVHVPESENNVQQNSIIANKNSGAFHRSSCSRLPKEKNRVYFNTREEALAAGYNNPCDYCNP